MHATVPAPPACLQGAVHATVPAPPALPHLPFTLLSPQVKQGSPGCPQPCLISPPPSSPIRSSKGVQPHLISPPPSSLLRCCLGERSAGPLGAALASTCCLEQLDLSWNNLGVRLMGQGGGQGRRGWGEEHALLPSGCCQGGASGTVRGTSQLARSPLPVTMMLLPPFPLPRPGVRASWLLASAAPDPCRVCTWPGTEWGTRGHRTWPRWGGEGVEEGKPYAWSTHPIPLPHPRASVLQPITRSLRPHPPRLSRPGSSKHLFTPPYSGSSQQHQPQGSGPQRQRAGGRHMHGAGRGEPAFIDFSPPRSLARPL